MLADVGYRNVSTATSKSMLCFIMKLCGSVPTLVRDQVMTADKDAVVVVVLSVEDMMCGEAGPALPLSFQGNKWYMKGNVYCPGGDRCCWFCSASVPNTCSY